MSYSFEYIDIILLAMIAGFIFLRLRGILGKRTGFEGKTPPQFDKILKEAVTKQTPLKKENFDEAAQKEFLNGAKIAYETIITDFSDNDNKLTTSKPLLNKEIYNQFNEALKERSKRGHYAEITFIGINSATIKEHKKIDKILKEAVTNQTPQKKENFDEAAQKEFLNGAKIAYETIITDFSDNDNKLVKSKPLLSKKIHDQFNEALKERNNRGHFAEITFIGINSASIKEHKKTNSILKVTVDFVGEVITCIKDKDKKIVSGNPDKIKKIYDTWVFSRDTRSNNPNWLLVDILT